MANPEDLFLTEAEFGLITHYLEFYQSLDEGSREPSTEEQQHFVHVCQGLMKAETEHEIAYVKYRMLMARQRIGQNKESSEISEYGEGVPAPGWFTDADW